MLVALRSWWVKYTFYIWKPNKKNSHEDRTQIKKKGILKSILYTPSYFAFLLVLNHYVPLNLLLSFIYFHLVKTCPLIIEKKQKSFPVDMYLVERKIVWKCHYQSYKSVTLRKESKIMISNSPWQCVPLPCQPSWHTHDPRCSGDALKQVALAWHWTPSQVPSAE